MKTLKTLTLFVAIFIANNLYAQPIIPKNGQKDCPPISTFPWAEDFEDNGTNIPPCWEKRSGGGGSWVWNIVPDTIGTPPTAFSGNYKARIYDWSPYFPYYEADLITPIFDLSTVDAPVLTFAYTKTGNNFYVYYKNSPGEGWKLLQAFSIGPVMEWQTAAIPLPNKSDYYQIAFIGTFCGGGVDCEVQLDDVRITEKVSVSSFHSDNYTLMPNPVQNLLTVKRSNATKVTISVYNSIGVLMHSFETLDTKFDVNVSNYATGFYFIRLSDSNTSVSKVFVKQ